MRDSHKDGKDRPKADKAKNVVFCRFFTTKNGRKIDAWQYGHKAWPIRRSK